MDGMIIYAMMMHERKEQTKSIGGPTRAVTDSNKQDLQNQKEFKFKFKTEL
jgi:hypothetical protein